MTPLELLPIIAGLAVVGTGIGYVVGYFTGRCSTDSPCPKCAFHSNEARMARLRRKDEVHERAHRDWDSCGDKTCPREHERANRLDR